MRNARGISILFLSHIQVLLILVCPFLQEFHQTSLSLSLFIHVYIYIQMLTTPRSKSTLSSSFHTLYIMHLDDELAYIQRVFTWYIHIVVAKVTGYLFDNFFPSSFLTTAPIFFFFFLTQYTMYTLFFYFTLYSTRNLLRVCV